MYKAKGNDQMNIFLFLGVVTLCFLSDNMVLNGVLETDDHIYAKLDQLQRDDVVTKISWNTNKTVCAVCPKKGNPRIYLVDGYDGIVGGIELPIGSCVDMTWTIGVHDRSTDQELEALTFEQRKAEGKLIYYFKQQRLRPSVPQISATSPWDHKMEALFYVLADTNMDLRELADYVDFLMGSSEDLLAALQYVHELKGTLIHQAILLNNYYFLFFVIIRLGYEVFVDLLRRERVDELEDEDLVRDTGARDMVRSILEQVDSVVSTDEVLAIAIEQLFRGAHLCGGIPASIEHKMMFFDWLLSTIGL